MSGPFWQPTDGQRRYYDRGADQMGQAAQSAATWQQRARDDPAEALRQRYAELHGIGPTLHAASGQVAMGPATQDAATHQRASEIGLEMMRREAELRAAQRVAPPQEMVTPLQLPMGGGTQTAPAAATGATQPDSNMTDSSAGGGITGSLRTREESPPRADEVVDDVQWNQRPLRVLDDRRVLQYTRLATISLDEVFGGTVIHEWSGETWLGVLRGVCRGATTMREAACRNWRDSRCSSLVLLKPLIAYVFGASLPAVTMEELEKVRDGVMEVMIWAFGVVLGDDDEWPEPRAHGASKIEKRRAQGREAVGVVRSDPENIVCGTKGEGA